MECEENVKSVFQSVEKDYEVSITAPYTSTRNPTNSITWLNLPSLRELDKNSIAPLQPTPAHSPQVISNGNVSEGNTFNSSLISPLMSSKLPPSTIAPASSPMSFVDNTDFEEDIPLTSVPNRIGTGLCKIYF